MSNSLFHENMSSTEAMTVLFRAGEGKTEEERKKILEEYDKVHYVIFQKEMDFVSAKAREGIIVLD